MTISVKPTSWKGITWPSAVCAARWRLSQFSTLRSASEVRETATAPMTAPLTLPLPPMMSIATIRNVWRR